MAVVSFTSDGNVTICRSGYTFDVVLAKDSILLPTKGTILYNTGVTLYMDTRAPYFCLLDSTEKCMVGGCVIDHAYKDTIQVRLSNIEDEPITFSPGDTIARMVFLPFESPTDLPERQFWDPVGYNVLLKEPVKLGGYKQNKYGIDFSLPFDQDMQGCFFDKSSIVLRHNCRVLSGILDSDKTIAFQNLGECTFCLESETAVAQLICLKKAGMYKLSSPYTHCIYPGETKKIDLNDMVIRNHVYCIFDIPSIVCAKKCIVLKRIIDPGRGENLHVCLKNMGKELGTFLPGNVLAECLVLPVIIPEMKQIYKYCRRSRKSLVKKS